MTTTPSRERQTPTPVPPIAPRHPCRHERFGTSWEDPYAWLRDPGYPDVRDPEILAHLEAENAYFDQMMAPHATFIERLHDELKARIKSDDHSVPVRDGTFEFHWRFFDGAQYRTWFRRRLDEAEARVVLDERELADGKSFFQLRALDTSPDGRLLAYTTDEDGSERFGLHLKDLDADTTLGDLVTNISGSVAWAEDGRSLLYVELNDLLRPFRVKAHRVGTPAETDVTIYEEDDPAFFVSIGKTTSRRFLLIRSGTHVTTEIRVIDARAPLGTPVLVAPRRANHRYSLDHAHGRFWILSNDTHANFRMVSAPQEAPSEAHWREEIAGNEHHYLLDVTCFEGFMVLHERADGLAHLRVRTYAGDEHVIDFHEAVYAAALGDNREFATDTIRVGYTSMVTPASVIDYRVTSRELVVRKVQEIPSGYDPSRYVSRRLLAPTADGVEVPITIVYRDDFPQHGGGPLLLYGYGSYGHSIDPAFAASRLTLLDRGFAFALAHVRGGDELGWHWYEDGKLAKKTNSFTDFIACAEYLIETGYARPGQIAIRGGSAGGMLMGAVANMRPDLWRCVVAEVPFVDVLNTMLDASLPLTPIEWPEWGDPLEDETAFRRILGYSPYDNIRPQPYPAMFVTAGIADPRVTYWEPAKFVARLRATTTGEAPVLFRVNMGAGHFGKSGRYDALHELAEQYAFVLDCFGLAESPVS